ncbi:MAG: hypothetical protein LC808_03420 [Actinobacteria bacterium]|nr:hypothetical protein [Actinomycetota bacterium]
MGRLMLMLAVTEAPWWGVPVVAGVFALLGVLIAQVVSLTNEKRKDRRRLDNDVREVCTRLLKVSAQLQAKGSIKGPLLGEMLNSNTELQLIAPVSIAKAGGQLVMCMLAESIDGDLVYQGHTYTKRDTMEARARLTNELRVWLDLDRLDGGEIM